MNLEDRIIQLDEYLDDTIEFIMDISRVDPERLYPTKKPKRAPMQGPHLPEAPKSGVGAFGQKPMRRLKSGNYGMPATPNAMRMPGGYANTFGGQGKRLLDAGRKHGGKALRWAGRNKKMVGIGAGALAAGYLGKKLLEDKDDK